MNKKILLATMLVICLVAAGIVSTAAKAEDQNGQGDGQDNQQKMQQMSQGGDEGGPSEMQHPQPRGKALGLLKHAVKVNGDDMELGRGNGKPQLTINGEDRITVRNAKVTSVSGQTLGISVFGIPFTVMASTSVKFIGIADLSHVNATDTVSVAGTINESNGQITASVIRDDSQQQQNNDTIRQQIQALLKQLQALKSQMGGLEGNGQGDNEDGHNQSGGQMGNPHGGLMPIGGGQGGNQENDGHPQNF